MANKTVKIRLSKSSVDDAIKEIKQYRQDIINKSEILAQRLAEIGVGIAEMHITDYDAIYSGDLVSSMKLRKGDVLQYKTTFYVYTDCPWAKFVEFGTGIVGARDSHPLANEKGWKYDVNNHGERGWYYYKDGAYHWTDGMQARPFMLETSWDLSERVVKVAKEVFRNA